MRAQRRGFTLIELLIVVVIISILAALAIPRFADSKGKANTQTMRSDLRNIAIAQDGHYYTNGIYTTDLSQLNFSPSQGVVLTIVQADASGWAAKATHVGGAPTDCALFAGGATPVAPATVEGKIACSN